MKKEAQNNKSSVFLKAILLETVVTAIFIFIFAVIMYLGEIGFEYSAVFGTVSVAAGCFAGGFYAAKKIGQKGLINGAIIGIITFGIVTLISLIVDDGAITFNTLFHLIIFMLSAIIGGIIGVNKREKRNYI